MIKIANDAIIKEIVLQKQDTQTNPITNQPETINFHCIEIDIIDDEGVILETWNWQVDANNPQIPTKQQFLDATGIKFGVSQWEFPDETTIL